MEHPAEEYAREIAYETIRQQLFGHGNGLTIGRYQLERSLARGGMGEVHTAYDPELERRVAIKLVGKHVDGESPGVRDALVRDARCGARVQHPNVVEIYDCGLENGDFYVVMELIDGQTLERWLEDRPRTWRKILETFLQAGEGLASVHAHGLVHRDFKPANVLVEPDGRARVVDFGLARIMDDLRVTTPGDEATSAPSSGTKGGTWAYMSPEQHEGGHISPLADQFAFCNALYRALFRGPPFRGHSEELSANVLAGRLQLPLHRHGAPRALVRHVLRGLAVHPEHRHPSMDVLLDRLRTVLRRRRQSAWGAGVAMAVLTAAAVGHRVQRAPCSTIAGPWTVEQRGRVEDALGSTRLTDRAKAAPAMDGLVDYAESWTRARRDACEEDVTGPETARRLTELRFACLDRKRAAFSSVWTRIAAEDGPRGARALELIGIIPPVSDCGPETVLEASAMARRYARTTDRSASPEAEQESKRLSARLAVARVEGAMGGYERAVREARGVEAGAKRLGLRYLLAEALMIRGTYGVEVARNPRDVAAAHEALEQAAPLALESGSNRLAAQAYLMWGLAQPRWTNAEVLRENLRTARSLTRTLPDEHYSRSLLARIEMALAELFVDEGRLDEAAARYRSAKRISDDGVDADSSTNGMAKVLWLRGDEQAAEELWQRLRTDYEQSGRSRALRINPYDNLAMVALSKGEYDEALSLTVLAEDLHLSHGSSDWHGLLGIRMRRARALAGLKRFSEVSELLAPALAAVPSHGEKGRRSVSEARELLVHAQTQAGRVDDARRVARDHLAFVQEDREPDRLELARAQKMLAEVALNAGDGPEALSAIAEAHALVHETNGWLRINVDFTYAKVASAAGDREQARRLLADLDRMFEDAPGSQGAREHVATWAREQELENG